MSIWTQSIYRIYLRPDLSKRYLVLTYDLAKFLFRNNLSLEANAHMDSAYVFL